MEKLLCPSLLNLSDDCLRDEVRALDRSGADILHLDVMDGDYVPNFGMSFNEIATVRANTGLPLDLHMTMRNPRRYVRRYAACGVDIIYIHPDSEAVPTETLALIRDLGKHPGIVINPRRIAGIGAGALPAGGLCAGHDGQPRLCGAGLPALGGSQD